jgi:opacity protein-like surface antigen
MLEKKRIICFLLLAQAMLVWGNTEEKILRVSPVKEHVKIDGRLNEAVYGEAEPGGDFVQYHPNNGAPPTFHTQVYSFYDNQNIYFGFKCFDPEPEKIVADITPFGDFRENDDVAVYIDTFRDKNTYNIFYINPKGIKAGKRTVWDAGAVITDYGWSAEVKIPFKSLRFPVDEIQEWRVNFRRRIFRKNEIHFWTSVTRDRLSIFGETFGRLEGIKGIRGGKNIEIFPYTGYRHSTSADETDRQFAYGLDVKYGITSNLTLDLTSSPDYSHVESDPFFYQTSPYEHRLRENRPFYNEGNAHFDTMIDLFYSRRITNPFLAAKVTGKTGRVAMGLMLAGNRGQDGEQDRFHGVFRLKKDVFNLSYIGLIYSAIEEKGNYNRNVGVDFKFQFKEIYRIRGMAAFSYNKDLSNKQNGMYRLIVSRVRDEGFTFLGLIHRVDPDVYVPAGYVVRNDYQDVRLICRYSFRWEGKFIERLNMRIWRNFSSSVRGPINTVDTYELEADIETRSRFSAMVAYYFGKERAQAFNAQDELVWLERRMPVKSLYTELEYYGSNSLKIGGDLWLADGFVYNEDFTGIKEGDTFNVSAWSQFKFSSQLHLTARWERSHYYSDDRDIEFTGNLFSAALNYQINKRLSSFLKFQYDSYLERFQYDFLIGFEPANVSTIYLSIKNYSEHRFKWFTPDARSIVFKISYLFRI